MGPNPFTLAPADALLIIGYVTWAHILALVTFKLFTIDNWLADFCRRNGDFEIYQASSPP
ncbi:MAG: hypothetical protein ACM369_03175 [Acidobacteriota bacterium]